MEFAGFLGNPGVKAALQDACSAGRFPHALILQGEPGTGRRTLAGLVARALVCRAPAGAPCGACPACIRAQAGSHPDIRVVEGRGPGGGLSVDMVKAVQEDAQRMPDEADYSIYILVLGDQTLEAPQNKLLKLMEEPPGSAVFILVCRSAQTLLPTIRSRAQVLTLLPPGEDEAAMWIQERKGLDEGAARQLALLCGGNLGRMLGELENGFQRQAMEVACAMVQAMTARGGHQLLRAAAPLQKDRALLREVLQRLGLIFRDACVLRWGGTALLGGAPEEADRLGDLPQGQLLSLPGIVEEYRQGLERNGSMGLLVTCLCADLRAAAGR